MKRLLSVTLGIPTAIPKSRCSGPGTRCACTGRSSGCECTWSTGFLGRGMRAAELLGRRVADADGRVLGRVKDLRLV